MIDPDRERKRAAAAQQQAQDQAQAGMAAPGADMVAVFSVAGFELADIFAEWSNRCAVEAAADGLAWMDAARPQRRLMCGGLGPPWPLEDEAHDQYGQRVARAILQLIKEV